MDEEKNRKEEEIENEGFEIETKKLEESRKFVAAAKKRLLQEDEGFGTLKGALLISEV